MNEEKKWMLMTYYCPTHGDLGRVEPIEITKKEVNKFHLKNSKLQQGYLNESNHKKD